ncbi:MAG TPA: TetR family transcriptional regulator [Mycobacteriales bacterium]|jgi:AcrR family transcriptional regulator|nr:TetR family transcriptional regulator [Mycobacteriales bacterium]
MPEVRDALLDAAYDLAVTTGWQRTRMADVAAAAGVSRQTVYDRFGSRDALAAALALRETQRFLDGVERALAAHAEPVEAIAAAAAFALDAARDNPLLRSILTDEGGLLPYVTTRAEPLVDAARARLAAYVTSRWDAANAAEAAEVVVRLALSYIVLPGDATAARRIADVATHVLDARKVTAP